MSTPSPVIIFGYSVATWRGFAADRRCSRASLQCIGKELKGLGGGIAERSLPPGCRARALPGAGYPCRRQFHRDDLGSARLTTFSVCAALIRNDDHRDLVGDQGDGGASSRLRVGIGVPVAMEGALKLKEISYIHAEAYPAGEMKHGPIALITDRGAGRGRRHTGPHVREGREQHPGGPRARSERHRRRHRRRRRHHRSTPSTSSTSRGPAEALSAIPASVPLQLLAYYIAKLRGCNVDQPRNLAKSVTVE